jgi:hypothetical protein
MIGVVELKKLFQGEGFGEFGSQFLFEGVEGDGISD